MRDFIPPSRSYLKKIESNAIGLSYLSLKAFHLSCSNERQNASKDR